MDLDECVSAPCQNGAGCTDSRDKTWDGKPIVADAFSCACVAGFTRGTCAYNFIKQYTKQCSIAQGGTCDVDVNECSSNPCVNGATCTESASDSSIPVGQYSCSCVAGFTNGVCNYAYDKALPIAQKCSVKTGGTCNEDVNECASSPCANGAACDDSSTNSTISAHAYRCTCLKGLDRKSVV